MIPRIHILLGRNGDIVSFLPILWHESQSGQRPAMMVAKEYASLFDGISYADCIPFDGDYLNLDGAMDAAKQIATDVNCVQVVGPPEVVKRCTYEPHNADRATQDSFIKEHWRFAGHEALWKHQPPLVFDRRDVVRETALIDSLNLPKKKKVVLVSLGGHTSPFPYPDLVWTLLRLKFGKTFHFVDVSAIKAERFYDLLGLYELAHCLVASDSAPLHLAAAVRLPVVALITDQPTLWHGSLWRPNHIAHIRYADFPHRADDMLTAIDGIGDAGCPFRKIDGKKVIHVWSGYEVIAENKQRTADAQNEWLKNLPDVIQSPAELGAFGKDSANILHDDKRYPTLKDVVRLGCMRAADDGVICLTRCDTAIGIAAANSLLDRNLPAFARRVVRVPEGDEYNPAVDLFMFTKKWWDAHVTQIPNFLLAQDTYWWRVLLDFFLRQNATELPFSVYRYPGEQIVPLKDSPPRLVYNEKLAKEYWEKYPSRIEPPRVTQQTETGWLVNRHALRANGYNPSIIRYGKRTLMAYRWHVEYETQTRLAIAEMDEKFNVTVNKDIWIEAKSAEDPRLFMLRGQLWMGYVDSNWPDPNPKCVTKYGRLREHDDKWTLEELHQPNIGTNDGSKLEKNWVFFDHHDKLFCIYQVHKEQFVYEMDGEKAVAGHLTKGPRWSWGAIRGGTGPFPYKGKWLRFFHSGLDNEPAPWRRRYYTGALIMEPEPPFKIIALSQQPILRGSRNDELSEMERAGINQYKAQVVFPCGAIQRGDSSWLLSAGVNDAACGLIVVTDKELNF